MFLLSNKLNVLIINKIMQFYRYLIIKDLKLLNMMEYDKFKYGLFHQDRKLFKRDKQIF